MPQRPVKFGIIRIVNLDPSHDMADSAPSHEIHAKVGCCLAVAVIAFLLAVPLHAPAMAAADALQQMVNYIFTGRTDPQDAPEIVERKSCLVLVHEPKFDRYARYYLSRFKMGAARISKKYAGSQVLFELEVEGDDIILEYLKADKRTVDYGFKSAHIPLPGNIEQTEKALRLISAEHCRGEAPKPPF